MPTNRTSQNPKYKNRPWHARAKIHGTSYSLGYYTTHAEALAVEKEFHIANGSERPTLKKDRAPASTPD